MLLSVIMTNYNHGTFLRSRLNSILEQLPDKSEMVVVDDGSTDDSTSILEDLAIRDSRIRIIKNPKNLGVVKSVNIALHAAKGKYIASLAADDKILPGFFDQTMSLLLANPEIGICCSDCGLSFDGFDGRDPSVIESTPLYRGGKEWYVFQPRQALKMFRSSNFWIPGHTSIIKRESMMRAGGFHEKLEFLCDWFLLHMIALQEGVAYIPQTLSVWRQHPTTYSHALQTDERRKMQVYRQLLQILASTPNRKGSTLFKRSTLLYAPIKLLFKEIVWQPKYWSFIFPIVIKALKIKIYKLRDKIGSYLKKALPLLSQRRL